MHGFQSFHYCPVCGSRLFSKNSQKSLRCSDCGFEFFENPAAANVAFIVNESDELLVVRRKSDPAKGTLDLPGGFTDALETAEEAVAREVLEETNLNVEQATYLFSLPNIYRFSGIDIPTLDMFFACTVRSLNPLLAADDAAECLWVPARQIQPEQFGLLSIRRGVERWLQLHNHSPKT